MPVDTSMFRFLREPGPRGRWVSGLVVVPPRAEFTKNPRKALALAASDEVHTIARFFGLQVLTYEQAKDAAHGEVR